MKPASQRQRRNRTSTGATIEAPPVTRTALPSLPEGWHPLSLTWWSTIWASPMANEWVDADVPGLFALASLVNDFWSSARELAPQLAAEIRMQQREYGLSPLSRRQLQWEIKRVEAATKPTPVVRERSRTGRGLLSVLEGRKSG